MSNVTNKLICQFEALELCGQFSYNNAILLIQNIASNEEYKKVTSNPEEKSTIEKPTLRHIYLNHSETNALNKIRAVKYLKECMPNSTLKSISKLVNSIPVRIIAQFNEKTLNEFIKNMEEQGITVKEIKTEGTYDIVENLSVEM